MRETPVRQEVRRPRKNLLGRVNPQGSLRDPSTTLRLAPEKGEDKVCSAWRHAEVGRNDLPRLWTSNT